ncbi:hypothetical protein ACKXGD_16640, partial [Enterococcus lactis]
MANILRKWVESDKREVKRLSKLADKVEAYADEISQLSDDELKAKTPEFQQRYQDGETLDDL